MTKKNAKSRQTPERSKRASQSSAQVNQSARPRAHVRTAPIGDDTDREEEEHRNERRQQLAAELRASIHAAGWDKEPELDLAALERPRFRITTRAGVNRHDRDAASTTHDRALRNSQ